MSNLAFAAYVLVAGMSALWAWVLVYLVIWGKVFLAEPHVWVAALETVLMLALVVWGVLRAIEEYRKPDAPKGSPTVSGTNITPPNVTTSVGGKT